MNSYLPCAHFVFDKCMPWVERLCSFYLLQGIDMDGVTDPTDEQFSNRNSLIIID